MPSLIALFGAQFAVSQPPDIEWARCYGGSRNEVARCIRQTTDGGYVVVGNAASQDGDVKPSYGNGTNPFCWILKLNNSGDTAWTTVISGTEYNIALSVQEAPDGGYVLVAQSSSTDGDFVGGTAFGYDCWIIKLDAAGAVLWKRRYGGSENDIPRDIQRTSDGGYIVAGASQSNDGSVWGNHGEYDYWLLRLDANGDTLWTKCLGGKDEDLAYSVRQTSDNGYIVSGQSRSNDQNVWGNHGGVDFWIVKLDSSGDTLWTKCLGGTKDDHGHTVLQTVDGGYIVGGSSKSNDGDVSGHHGDSTKADVWIVKLSSTGDILWQKSLGGTDHDAFDGTALLSLSSQQTSDLGYAVACRTNSNDEDVSGNHGRADVWVVKLSADGTIEWQKCMGGTGDDMGESIQQATDGGYIVAGRAAANSGDVSGNHGGTDVWVVKLTDPTTGVVESLSDTKPQLYPNPADDVVTINNTLIGSTLLITDITGQTIYRTVVQHQQTLLSTERLVSGIYFVQVENNGALVITTLIVNR